MAIGMMLCGLAAVLIGGLTGLITGYLRARRGSHEVVTSIMVNFLATAITSWLVLEKFHSIDTHPEAGPGQKEYDYVCCRWLWQIPGRIGRLEDCHAHGRLCEPHDI